MTIQLYNEAIGKLRENDIEIDYDFPKDDKMIEILESTLGHHLPLSYKKMLSEFGVLGFEGQDIYGLGLQDLEAKSPFNVFYSTDRARHRLEITDKMVKFMVSGYGPYFVLDCGQLDQRGEAPVYEINELGYKHGMKKVADSFGEFLLNEVNMMLQNR
jgi:SMI1-KNR4 cell-wall